MGLATHSSYLSWLVMLQAISGPYCQTAWLWVFACANPKV